MVRSYTRSVFFGFLSFLLLILDPGYATAQVELQKKVFAPLPISRKDFSTPKSFYGISRAGEDFSTLQGVFLIPLKVEYQIGPQKSSEGIPARKILVGFAGISNTSLVDMDVLWAKPSDTTTQPGVHTLLSDVFVQNAAQLDLEDMSEFFLIAVDLNANKMLADNISKLMKNPADAKGILFILCNKQKCPELPPAFKVKQKIEMQLTEVEKVDWPGKSIAKTETPEVPVIPPAAVTPPPAPVNPPSSPETQPAALNAEPKATEPGLSETPVESPVNRPVITKLPEINPIVYPEILAFISGRMSTFNESTMYFKFSAHTDTLRVLSKESNRQIRKFQLNTIEIPVNVEQAETNRRESDPDPEALALIGKNKLPLIFAYKGQQLFFDQVRDTLVFPELFQSRSDIILDCEAPSELKASKNSKNEIVKFNASIRFPKTTLKLDFFDPEKGRPIDYCYLQIGFPLPKEGDPIIKYKVKDGIPDMISMEGIKYKIFITDPVYDKLSIVLSPTEINAGKRVNLSVTKSYSIIYTLPMPSIRIITRKSLESRLESIKAYNIPFSLFVSNAERPYITSDTAVYRGTLQKIQMLFDDKPNLNEDFTNFNNAIQKLDLATESTIKIQFYMPYSVYKDGGRMFISRIVNDGIILPHDNIRNIKVYVFLDKDIDPRDLINYNKETQTGSSSDQQNVNANVDYFFYNLSKE